MLPIFSEPKEFSENPKEAVKQISQYLHSFINQLYSFLTTLDETNFSSEVGIENLTVNKITVKGNGKSQGSVTFGSNESNFSIKIVNENGEDVFEKISEQITELDERLSDRITKLEKRVLNLENSIIY